MAIFFFILSQQVHQGHVYGKGIEFYSYRRVLSEMGPPYSSTMELASFSSISMDVMGEYVLFLFFTVAFKKFAYTDMIVNMDMDVMAILGF